MRDPAFPWEILGEPKLAVHATSALPAWLWSVDGTRLLWANPGGAAIFGAATSAGSRDRSFERDHPAAAQVARVAASLPPGGTPRLERLRGFGASFGRLLTCACARITFDNAPAILIGAVEPAGPYLPLAERARRLFEGCGEAVAVYAARGDLLYATPEASAQLGGATSLSTTAVTEPAKHLGQGADEVQVLRLPKTETKTEIKTAPATVTEETETAADAVDLSPIAMAISAAQKIIADEHARQAARPAGDSDAASPAAAHDDAQPAHDETTAVSAPGATIADSSPPNERRHPLRFVWKIDTENRFSIDPGDFMDVMGPKIAAELNRPWISIVSDLDIDPNGDVARAIASRDTWSGVTIDWPVEGSAQRIAVELAGLPVYDRDRNFRGYRGFGVCRDVARVIELLAQRRQQDNIPVAADMAQAVAPDTRSALSLVPPSENVVPFRPSANDAKGPTLNPLERSAFRELATRLSARLKSADELARGEIAADADEQPAAGEPVCDADAVTAPEERVPIAGMASPDRVAARQERLVLDRLPAGILIYRHEHFFYANRAFLDWAGHESLQDFVEAGGLDTLFIEPQAGEQDETIRIAAPGGDKPAVKGRLSSIPWDGATAMMLTLADATPAEQAAPPVPAPSGRNELRAILDVAIDGVVTLDRAGTILSANAGAEQLFGYDEGQLVGLPFTNLFASDSAAIARNAVLKTTAAGPDKGRDITGRTRRGNSLPLLMTAGLIDETGEVLCAAFQDLSRWKTTERELVNARKQAETVSSAKSEFLAKVSHEIRTPLNAIIGFSEIMMNERFGPIGSERYKEYLKDIHGSGTHVVSLVNDLLDLSKIEAGKLDLALEQVNLNDLTQQSVAVMQPQASRERIIIRTSLAPELPSVVADARSVRQIVLNLLSNSIKFTGAGGQVILSTARSDHGEAVLRVRDTGIGMSEKDIATALEPFRQLSTAVRLGSNGTGLGLPLTKALAEANSARFSIKSAVNAGTLVEIVFPAVRAAE